MLLPTIDADADGLKYVPMAKIRLKLLEEQRKASGLPFIHRRVFSDGTTTVDITASEFAPKIRVRTADGAITAAIYTYTVSGQAYSDLVWLSRDGSVLRRVALPSVSTTTIRLLADASQSAAVVLERDSSSPASTIVRFVVGQTVESHELNASTPGVPAGAVFSSSLSRSEVRASATRKRAAFAVCSTKDFASRTTSVSYAVAAPDSISSVFSVATVNAFQADTSDVQLLIEATPNLDTVYAWASAGTFYSALDLNVSFTTDSSVTHDVVRIAEAVASPRRHVAGYLAASGGSYLVSYYEAGVQPSSSVFPYTDREGYLRVVLNGAQVVEYDTVSTSGSPQPSITLSSFYGSAFVFTARIFELPAFGPPIETPALVRGMFRNGAVEEDDTVFQVSHDGTAVLMYSSGAVQFQGASGVFSMPSSSWTNPFFSSSSAETIFRVDVSEDAVRMYRSLLGVATDGTPTGFAAESLFAVVPQTIGATAVLGVDYPTTRGSYFVIPLARELYW